MIEVFDSISQSIRSLFTDHSDGSLWANYVSLFSFMLNFQKIKVAVYPYFYNVAKNCVQTS